MALGRCRSVASSGKPGNFVRKNLQTTDHRKTKSATFVPTRMQTIHEISMNLKSRADKSHEFCPAKKMQTKVALAQIDRAFSIETHKQSSSQTGSNIPVARQKSALGVYKPCVSLGKSCVWQSRLEHRATTYDDRDAPAPRQKWVESLKFAVNPQF